jgi:ribonuclease Y
VNIAIAIVAAVIGAALGYFLAGSKKKEQDQQWKLETEAQAQKLITEAETKAQQKSRALLEEAEEKATNTRKKAELDADELRLKAERKADENEKTRRAEFEKVELRLTGREEKLDERATTLDKKQSEILDEEKRIQRENQSMEDRTRNLKERESNIDAKLEEIAGLSREDARQQVVDSIIEDARLYAAKTARLIEEQAVEEADKRAKKVLAVTIQRYAGEYVTERTVSVVNLPNDDMKGRIIGREGRNIRALETATGCDFIIDDTPEAIIISAFDPVRREIARLSLERLMADGRIHPARIEELVEKTTLEIDKLTREAGEAAAFELGITGLHPEIIRFMGRLKYRTSYGQNIWSHSIEAGFLCGMMAGELGLNVKLARRAAFLHDIGKAMDHSDEGGHAIIGANFIKKYNEEEIIVNAVAAHHDEVPQQSVYAHLVIAADALSGARPGARREILESYVKRLEDLENISTSFPGVEKCYAIQAGREVRVMVSADKINDDQASMLSRDIARRIEQELTYPGQIRVTVIRETRATEIAR